MKLVFPVLNLSPQHIGGNDKAAHSERRLSLRSRLIGCAFVPLALGLAGCSLHPLFSGSNSPNPLSSATKENGTVSSATGEVASYGTLMRVGDATRRAGDPITAAGIYRRAHELDGSKVEPLIRLGFALLDAGNAGDATEAFRQAVEFKGDDAEAHLGLGIALLATDHPELAQLQLSVAAKTLTRDPRVYSGLGIADDLNGDHVAAQKHYLQGLTLLPDSRPLKNDLALSLALSGKYDNAIAILRPLALDSQGTVRNRQNLALIYGLAGRMEEAARVGRVDLDEQSVQSNLQYYVSLRALADNARTSAILKPSGAGMPPNAAVGGATGSTTDIVPPIKPAG